MPIGLHGQNAAIIVAEPACNSGDIHPGLDTDGRKEVPEIVMSHSRYLCLHARRID